MRFRSASNFVFAFAIVCILNSCSTPPSNSQEKTSIQTPAVSAKRVPIDTSGFSIELPSSMKIGSQQGPDFMVYYFTPIDTSIQKGEAGIYFGPKPDVHPPTTEYSQTEILAPFLGQTEKWTQYVTSKYTQREVFIENGEGQKIHAWCYSDNPAELENLFTMMKSIQR
jgi:hypothetical protein